MPVYEYKCQSCKYEFELRRRIGEGKNPSSCEICGGEAKLRPSRFDSYVARAKTKQEGRSESQHSENPYDSFPQKRPKRGVFINNCRAEGGIDGGGPAIKIDDDDFHVYGRDNVFVNLDKAVEGSNINLVNTTYERKKR